MKKQTYTVPEGCKITSVDLKTGVVIFECEEPKFKSGDFLRRRGDWIFILDFIDEEGVIYYKVLYDIDEKAVLGFNDCGIGCFSYDIRLATPEEKSLLLSKMHEAGKEWDEGNCKVVDYIWKPKENEAFSYLLSIDIAIASYCEEYHSKLIDTGNYFKTNELAEDALIKRNELLKTLKHY
jgi:hypothetical protein